MQHSATVAKAVASVVSEDEEAVVAVFLLVNILLPVTFVAFNYTVFGTEMALAILRRA